MVQNFARLTISIFFVCLFSVVCNGQVSNKESITKLHAELTEDEKAAAACVKTAREYQIKQFGKVLPKISGHCWDGCPTRVVKPYYPREARRLKIKGEVVVEAIVDERGEVGYAKVVKGNSFLRQAALAAAYKSTYQPKVTCGNRPIKFRWTIRYYFHPSM